MECDYITNPRLCIHCKQHNQVPDVIEGYCSKCLVEMDREARKAAKSEAIELVELEIPLKLANQLRRLADKSQHGDLSKTIVQMLWFALDRALGEIKP